MRPLLYPHPASSVTECQDSLPWTGRSPVSPGWFEFHPARIPRDARPVYDEELDCIIGYHRVFASVALTYDLRGDVASIAQWPGARTGPPLAQHLVVGPLWQAGACSMTRAGFRGEGAAISGRTLGTLRQHFIRLARCPLQFSLAALADMHEAERFAPLHILRLVIQHGNRHPSAWGTDDTVQFAAEIARRGVATMLEVTLRPGDHTVLRYRLWPCVGP